MGTHLCFIAEFSWMNICYIDVNLYKTQVSHQKSNKSMAIKTDTQRFISVVFA